MTGFPPGLVGGAIHLADAVALQAQNYLTTAFNGAPAGPVHPVTGIRRKTLLPGVYRFVAAQLTGH